MPEDGPDQVDPSTASNDDNLADEGPAADDRPEIMEASHTEENAATGAGDTEDVEHDAQEATPPRRFSSDPKHEMQP